MLTFLGYYLCVGLGVYLGCAAKEIKTLKEADRSSIIRGVLFGILAFPIALGIVINDELK